MPSVLLTESYAVELGASEPWPEDAQLYQPLEDGQIILPEKAACLSVQAFMKMLSLNFEVVMRPNAEDMSPTGKVPFIRCGRFVIAEMDRIVAFVNTKGIRLSEHLDNAQKADMRAYMSLINTVLLNAELYLSWCHKETYKDVTKVRYASIHPWPLKQILCHRKKYSVQTHLACFGWLNKTLDEVYAEVENCCSALSERLGSQKYFFGDRPTELDAQVFGHLITILTTPLPDNTLAVIIQRYGNLVELCRVIEINYFSRRN